MIKEDFSIDDLDLSLLNKEVVEDAIKKTQFNYIANFSEAELHWFLADETQTFIEEEETEENKEQLKLTKESLRQKRLANIKMIGQFGKHLKTLNTLLSKF